MLDISKITKVYSGRIGCMCGCNGKYSYTEEGARVDNPGYDVTDSINERSVKIIAKKVLTNPNSVHEEGMVYVEDKDRNRIQVIYYRG